GEGREMDSSVGTPPSRGVRTERGRLRGKALRAGAATARVVVAHAVGVVPGHGRRNPKTSRSGHRRSARSARGEEKGAIGRDRDVRGGGEREAAPVHAGTGPHVEAVAVPRARDAAVTDGR